MLDDDDDHKASYSEEGKSDEIETPPKMAREKSIKWDSKSPEVRLYNITENVEFDSIEAMPMRAANSSDDPNRSLIESHVVYVTKHKIVFWQGRRVGSVFCIFF